MPSNQRTLRNWPWRPIAACIAIGLLGGCAAPHSGPPVHDAKELEKLKTRILKSTPRPTLRPSPWNNWQESWKAVEVLSIREDPSNPKRALCVIRYDVERVIKGTQITPRIRSEIRERTVYFEK